MTTPIRTVALISGGGTTLENLISRIADGKLNAQIVGVIASRDDILGVERAQRANLPVTVVARTARASDDTQLASFSDRVWSAVRFFNPELVCLAGWLHLLSIPSGFHHKVLNIHPSLLPAFGGKGMFGSRVHEAVLASGVKISGCTVHFADATYDTGPILIQKCVPVREEDDAEALAARVFQAECEAYPEAINLISAGRIAFRGRRVVITG